MRQGTRAALNAQCRPGSLHWQRARQVLPLTSTDRRAALPCSISSSYRYDALKRYSGIPTSLAGRCSSPQ